MKVTNLFPSTISGEGNWKLPLIVLLSAFVACPLQAQAPPPEPPQAAVESTAQRLAPEALNELLAPIALYPDALIALILPASTVPADLVLAARYIASNGDPAQIANQPWDDSVKSLARYPDLLKWMDQNLEWTTQVGETFLDQPADVMNSIQQLRAQAIAAGNLVDTPQQTIVKEIVEEETRVRIVPAEPEVIYVPQYDPEVVYVEPYAPDFGPVVTFGVGFAVGSWLNYDCDWGRRTVCVGDWRPGWRHDRNWDRGDRDRDWDRDRDRDWDRGDRDRDWDRGNRGREWAGGDRGRNNAFNVVNINNNTARVWQPSARIQRQRAQRQRSYAANASKEYARAERRDGSGGGRRFGAVVKPSRPQFSDRTGDGDRQAWRNENSDRSARTARGEIRKPNSNAPTVSPRTQRSRDQAARSSQGNASREWKERGEGRRSDQSRGMVSQRAETPSIDESASQSDKIQGRKWRSDSSSVKTSPPPSVNVDQTRSERFTPSYSKTNDSRRQSRAKEVDSSRSQGPSYSEAKKSPQASRVERSQGRSQRSAASYSSPDKPPQASRVERSQGRRSQRSAASYSKPDKPPQASRVERSQGRSQRSAASYSKPDKPPQASRVERSQGRSQRSAASYSKPNKPSQAARAERSQARSQRSAASYSKPNRSSQPSKAAQGKSGGGGGKKSSKKADKEQS